MCVLRVGRRAATEPKRNAATAWRLAVIAEGVASRHRERQPEDADALRASQTSVERLASFARQSLAGR
jgi:hypothetical protein